MPDLFIDGVWRAARDKPMVDPRYFTHEHDERVMTHGCGWRAGSPRSRR